MFKNGICPFCNRNEVLEKHGDKYICIDCTVKFNFAMSNRKIANTTIEELKEYIKKYDSKDYNLITDGRTYKFVEYTKEEQELDRQYWELTEKSRELYYQAINQYNIDNLITKKCIGACLDDIYLANQLKEYQTKKEKFDNKYSSLPNYSTFYFLIMLYEKLGFLDDAIYMCKEAINLGFSIDNTKGGTSARLARLLKKKEKEKGEKICQQPQ